MRIGRVLGLAVLIGGLGSLPALAGPITGQPSDVPSNPDAASSAPSGGAMDTAFSAGSLFDPVGTPLLRTYGPYYVQPGARNKLRYTDPGFAGDYGSGYAGTGGPGAGGLGPGGGPIGNLNPELPIGTGGGDPLAGVGPVAIPEPATLLLLAPAAAIALRRRARARQ